MLNSIQEEAVKYIAGPSLIIAGAGSGKTRVLTHKIAYLIEQGYDPSSILALTFTNKAAGEMKERIGKLLGDKRISRRVWMGTFHSIFSRILRAEAPFIGFTQDFTIFDATDSKNAIKLIIREMQLDEKIYKPSTVASRISSAKNSLITPGMYAAKASIQQDDAYQKRPMIKEIYSRYVARCKKSNVMDFDDLLLNTNILFRDFPEVLARYQDLFRFVLVDEYQDTNFAQHLIVKQLAQGHGLVCAVGDDAQSIYSFRGAVIDNIIHFKNDFPGCRTFKLEQNYRSTQTIVNAANSIISRNQRQIQKNVFSENESGEKIEVIQCYSGLEEAAAIANKIARITIRENSFSDVAILYRTNSQSRVLEDALLSRNIPYRIYGGLSFYQRKEIKDIIAYLRLIVNRNDDEAFRRIINTPARGIGETTLKKVNECANLHNVSLWDVCVDPLAVNLAINSGIAKRLAGFVDLINQLDEQQSMVELDEFVELVIDHSCYNNEQLLEKTMETESRKQNLKEFINAIRDKKKISIEEDGTIPSLSNFLSEIALLSDQDVKSEKEEDLNKVTMMTIHSAKGLEFRHVMIVGMEEDLFPSQMASVEANGLEEERRLCYVAITRAEKSCTLSFAKSRYRNGSFEQVRPSRFLSEINPLFMTGDVPAQANPMASRIEERAKNFSRNMNHDLGKRQTTVSTPTPPPRREGNYQVYKEIPLHTRVAHERFGEGTVIAVEPDRVRVKFDEVGEKTLLLSFARFMIL